MDVTPTPKMFEVMSKMTDAFVGEAPHPKDVGPGAIKRRQNRMMMMDVLHNLIALAMREGGSRALREKGYPTIEGMRKRDHR